MSPGHVRVGASPSTTVTVNEHVSVSWAASVAVHVTTVGPFGKTSPDGGVQVKLAPVQLSVTLAP